MSLVRIETVCGDIHIEVRADRAPASAGYFLVDEQAGRYDGSSLFHIALWPTRLWTRRAGSK
jgi:hypothetical protein